MIFASVGSMFPFDRMVRALDGWAGAHPATPVLIQIGAGEFEPIHARWVRSLPPAAYKARLREAALFVAHAGMGSIISAIEAGRPLLIMPRLHRHGEINTEHQLATIGRLGARRGLHVAEDEAALGPAIDRLLAEGMSAPEPLAPFASPELIASVRGFIEAR